MGPDGTEIMEGRGMIRYRTRAEACPQCGDHNTILDGHICRDGGASWEEICAHCGYLILED